MVGQASTACLSLHHANCHINANTYTDANCHTNAHSDTDSYSNTNGDAYTNHYTDGNTNLGRATEFEYFNQDSQPAYGPAGRHLVVHHCAEQHWDNQC
jgi:hypothetical protein